MYDFITSTCVELSPELTIKELLDRFQERALVMHEIGGEILGAVRYQIFTRESSKKSCSLESIKIDDSQRRRGLGSLLFACMALDAKEKGWTHIKLTSTGELLIFYFKLGFGPERPLVSKETWEAYPSEIKLKLLDQTEDPIYVSLSKPALFVKLEQLTQLNLT
ncbi:MAG: hypothetical protein CK425_13030 [Parachlamydia sp.]|nr:MAG: hypothetical protein CK425_13030 [Parachlamydia sp.]